MAAELAEAEVEAPHEVYMDDRTWAAATAREAVWPIGVWARFSDAILLMENPAKVQLTARTAELRSHLETVVNGTALADKIREGMEVLGMTTRGVRRRALAKKELERIAATIQCIRAIGNLPLGRRMREMSVKGAGFEQDDVRLDHAEIGPQYGGKGVL